MSWSYRFFRLNGDGTETFLVGDVPVANPVPTRKLSTPHSITGALTPQATQLLEKDGQTMLRRWQTTAYVADDNDHIWVGGILVDYAIDGENLTFDVAGFTSYPTGMPYEGEYDEVQVDPLDVYRHCWDHLQGRRGANLGLELDATTSPVRIGDFVFTDADDPTTTLPKVERKGVTLNWWSTRDLGSVMDKLAAETPFDYLEDHYWDGDTVRHRLRLGYPTLGTRLEGVHAPRFVLGENVWAIPGEDYSGDDVVTEVWAYGAGEGRDRLVGSASIVPRDSVRRVRIIDDKTILHKDQAVNRAREELMLYQPDIPGAGISQLLVRDMSQAPYGSFDVGDEVAYSGAHHWGDVLIWVKIVTITLQPNGSMVLGVVRADTVKS